MSLVVTQDDSGNVTVVVGGEQVYPVLPSATVTIAAPNAPVTFLASEDENGVVTLTSVLANEPLPTPVVAPVVEPLPAPVAAVANNPAEVQITGPVTAEPVVDAVPLDTSPVEPAPSENSSAGDAGIN